MAIMPAKHKLFARKILYFHAATSFLLPYDGGLTEGSRVATVKVVIQNSAPTRGTSVSDDWFIEASAVAPVKPLNFAEFSGVFI